MTERTRSTPDALVVGAGPVGLMMAAELARCGVSCRIIDKLPTASSASRSNATAAAFSAVICPGES